MVALSAITLILSSVMVGYAFYLLNKARKIEKEGMECFLESLIMKEDVDRGFPISVSTWKNYIELLEANEQYEHCEEIREIIAGKTDNQLVRAPQGFRTFEHEGAIYIRKI